MPSPRSLRSSLYSRTVTQAAAITATLLQKQCGITHAQAKRAAPVRSALLTTPAMDGFHHDGFGLQPLPDLSSPLSSAHHDCGIETLTQSLAAAHVAHGMDPLDAALQAQLEAPLLHPFLP